MMSYDDLRVCDLVLILLHRAGWSIGDIAFTAATGTTWLVSGTRGSNQIRATGPTQSAAWAEAFRQARQLELIDRPPERSSLED